MGREEEREHGGLEEEIGIKRKPDGKIGDRRAQARNNKSVFEETASGPVHQQISPHVHSQHDN